MLIISKFQKTSRAARNTLVGHMRPAGLMFETPDLSSVGAIACAEWAMRFIITRYIMLIARSRVSFCNILFQGKDERKTTRPGTKNNPVSSLWSALTYISVSYLLHRRWVLNLFKSLFEAIVEKFAHSEESSSYLVDILWHGCSCCRCRTIEEIVQRPLL